MKQFATLFALLLVLSRTSGAQTPDFKVPEWAKKVVWYQIFPDRFHNGDTTNDPPPGSQFHAWPHDTINPWQIHPWTSDWYALQPYEKANGKNLSHNLTRRRYGGDLQGILNKLDYLQQLGITAIYLNPVFWSPSHHKYDGFMYHHIDPYLGPDPEADIARINKETYNDPESWTWTSADLLALKLIKSCHERGIRIIFDGVFNHLGSGSIPFQDVLKNQQASPYKNWFMIKSWDDSVAGTRFAYDGWFGVSTLPEIKEDSNGIVAEPKAYIMASTRRWMDPTGKGDLSAGIDGWRLDVAFCVAHPFWKEWRTVVKSINPDAYLTAEVIDEIHKVQPYLQGDEFDAIMNYNFAFACADYFVSEKTRITTSAFEKQLEKLRQAYPPSVTYVQQNLFGSHDSNRLNSHIVNRDFARYGDWGDYFGKSRSENVHYNTRKPTPSEYEIQKLFAVFQMTYVGAPMVYYGDEAGMWGANDPDCRKPMVWAEFNHAPEMVKADGSSYPEPQVVAVNQDMLAHYRKLIHIRNNYPALQTGAYRTLATFDKEQVFAFERSLPGARTVWVILNNSSENQEFALSIPKKMREIYTGENFTPTQKIKLAPKSFLLLAAPLP